MIYTLTMKGIFKSKGVLVWSISLICFVGIMLIDLRVNLGIGFECLIDIVIFVLGLVSMIASRHFQSTQKPKTELIDPRKLAAEIASDEKRQLEAKVKTLEAALNKLLK